MVFQRICDSSSSTGLRKIKTKEGEREGEKKKKRFFHVFKFDQRKGHEASSREVQIAY